MFENGCCCEDDAAILLLIEGLGVGLKFEDCPSFWPAWNSKISYWLASFVVSISEGLDWIASALVTPKSKLILIGVTWLDDFCFFPLVKGAKSDWYLALTDSGKDARSKKGSDSNKATIDNPLGGRPLFTRIYPSPWSILQKDAIFFWLTARTFITSTTTQIIEGGVSISYLK